MKLLMHICCGVCSVYPLGHLRGAGMEVTGLWYNPNIHPEDEYASRLSSVRRLADDKDLEIIYRDGYGLEAYRDALEANGAGTERPSRCWACYSMRMIETARECVRGGYDAFTTSLLVSPFQDHDLIARVARDASDETGASFHYEDFRPGWRTGRAMAREMGLYSQYYCGCIYSKAERDAERARRTASSGKALRDAGR